MNLDMMQNEHIVYSCNSKLQGKEQVIALTSLNRIILMEVGEQVQNTVQSVPCQYPTIIVNVFEGLPDCLVCGLLMND